LPYYNNDTKLKCFQLLGDKISKFVISGKKQLTGEIAVFGAKNAAMKMIAASILINGKVILNNIPDILDIQKLIEILEKMGGKFLRRQHTLEINLTNLRAGNPDTDLVKSMRASVVLLGPLLARFGKVKIPHPGGCLIGKRPIDRHIRAFRELGVEIEEKDDYYDFKLGKITKDKISFEKISVTGTENIILFASGQDLTLTIKNAAIEPEIIDLIEFLKKSGAKIIVDGRTINIQGNTHLQPIEYSVVPDRIETGTFAILSALAGNLKITQINPGHIDSLLKKFDEMGIKFEKGGDWLYIKKPFQFNSCDLVTAEYPGFATDLQSPMGVLLTQAKGKSIITENIFENRLAYLAELSKMGAKINIVNSHQAEVFGPTNLHGAKIQSLDLRSGVTLLIAGLIAQGETEILQAEIIDRGYEKIEERLQKLGAEIKRV